MIYHIILYQIHFSFANKVTFCKKLKEMVSDQTCLSNLNV